VRWHPASPELSDHPENGPGLLAGSSAEAARLAVSFSKLTYERLVILGAPGSGKSTLALLILLALIDNRVSGDSVPVLLSAASWDPAKDHLNSWLIREIDRIYEPLQHGTSIGKTLLNEQKLIPIVDGLDELHASKRSLAIREINRALAVESSVILTCRQEEYDTAIREGDVLTSATVIAAEPLRPGEIITYLSLSSSPIRISAWKPVFDRVMDPEDNLAGFFSTALNVWLARQVYEDPGSSPTELTDSSRFPTTRHLQDHLVSSFITNAYSTEPPRPREADYPSVRRRHWSEAKAGVWLGVLASHLERLGTSDLAWWRLRDAVPPIGVSVVFGVTGGIVFGVAAALKDNTGYFFGIMGALAVGFAVGFRKTPEPRYLDLHGLAYVRSALRLVGRVAAVVIACWIAGGEIFGIAFGAIGGVAVGAIQLFWISIRPDEARGPAALLRLHKRLFFRNLLAGGLGGACVGLLASPLVGGGDRYLSGAVTGLLGGLMIGAAAASPWLGYRVAHGWLAVQRKAPWRLMTFLDDSYERSVMRQVGAAYQFRHLQLQKRLATDVSYRWGPESIFSIHPRGRAMRRQSSAGTTPVQSSDQTVDS
jgi:energy-coupling factor transporter ATP-binding protein EcfA2